MKLSAELEKQSVSENGVKPRAGVVIAKNGAILGQSFRGETGEGQHSDEERTTLRRNHFIATGKSKDDALALLEQPASKSA